MSQYTIKPNKPNHKILVGWEQPLGRYFVTVLAEDNYNEIVLLSLTTLSFKLLETVLENCGYCDHEAISSEILHSLWADRDGVAF